MKPCILLVEDNDFIRENTTEILELSNFEVLAAADGIDGIELLQKKIPDLILCDILMPKMGGYEFFREIQKNESVVAVPFIFLTALCEKKEVEKALDMGARAFIIKPFDADELIGIVQKHLNHSAQVL